LIEFRKNVNLGGPGNDPAKSIRFGNKEGKRLMLGEVGVEEEEILSRKCTVVLKSPPTICG